MMNRECYSFRAMNTDVHVIEEFPWSEGNNEEMKRWFQEVEQTCSRFLPANELAQFNEAEVGTVMKVSPLLFEVIKQAIHYSTITDGYFNPLVGRNMEEIGYDRSFEQMVEIEESHDPVIAPREVAPFQFDDASCTILKQTEEKIDLGGLAKGWAVDRGARLMRQVGVAEGQLNAGGDLTIWGDQETLLGIAHPEKEAVDIAQFYMREGSVATSNKVFRSWRQGAIQRHHLLNGQTGLPADSDIVQATVFAKTTAEAEVIAKVLCIFTFDKALSWMLNHFPHAAALIIHENGQVKVSHTIKHYTKKLMLS
ncbi:ApbE family lipoprotein [Bacillaceae bacterium SAS-127]|nr:ApbE family lipoprotein [Bacillaceae bacterium SAS-127]